MLNDRKKIGDDPLINRIVIGVAIFAITAWLANLLFGIYFNWGEQPNTDRGTFGDVFGAVNSVFSGVAFIGVVWSLLLQRTELRVAKEDRDATLALSKEQSNTIKLQRFENTFFQLFSAFSSVAESMEVSYLETDLDTLASMVPATNSGLARRLPSKKITIKGRAAFETLIKEIGKEVEKIEGKKNSTLENDIDLLEGMRHRKHCFSIAYGNFFTAHGDDIGRYFRSLYTIMRFMERSEIPDDQRHFYFKFLRAQLSMHESTLLALNYASEYTTPIFNFHCRKYGMAKNADLKNPTLSLVLFDIPEELFGTIHSTETQRERAELVKSIEGFGKE